MFDHISFVSIGTALGASLREPLKVVMEDCKSSHAPVSVHDGSVASSARTSKCSLVFIYSEFGTA